jgi:hypothetical protein
MDIRTELCTLFWDSTTIFLPLRVFCFLIIASVSQSAFSFLWPFSSDSPRSVIFWEWGHQHFNWLAWSLHLWAGWCFGFLCGIGLLGLFNINVILLRRYKYREWRTFFVFNNEYIKITKPPNLIFSVKYNINETGPNLPFTKSKEFCSSPYA